MKPFLSKILVLLMIIVLATRASANDDLYESAKNGNTELLYQLLWKGKVDPNKLDKKGRSALQIAFEEGHLKAIEILLLFGANPNFPDENGDTLLHRAFRNDFFNNLNFFNLLVVHSGNAVASITTANKFDNTPLQLAIMHDRADIVALFLEYIWGALNNEEALLQVVQAELEEIVNLKDNLGFSVLDRAAQHGYTNAIRALVRLGVNVNRPTPKQGFALHTATLNGQVDVVRVLLEEGANVNIATEDGTTALHIAAGNGDLETMELLLARGADVNGADSFGHTPLHVAAFHGQVHAVEFLFVRNALVDARSIEGFTPLHRAVLRKQEEAIRALHRCEANLNNQNEHRNTPLHFAARWGNIQIINLLLDLGAQINIINADGDTPLDRALKHNQFEAARILVERGGTANQAIVRNVPPANNTGGRSQESLDAHLLEAIAKRDWEKIRALLDQGANPCIVVHENGDTLLHDLAGQGLETEGIQAMVPLVAHYAGDQGHFNIRGANGDTPLHRAAQFGRVFAVRCFGTSYRVELNAQNNDGSTPLHLAIEGSHVTVVQQLLNLHVNISAQNKKGQTALHLAVEICDYKIIKALLLAGASLRITDAQGNTPLHLLAQNTDWEALKVLQEIVAQTIPEELAIVLEIRNNEQLTPLDVARNAGAHALLERLQQYILIPQTYTQTNPEATVNGDAPQIVCAEAAPNSALEDVL